MKYLITDFNKYKVFENESIINGIYDKINQYGIDSLNDYEKECLDKYSRDEKLPNRTIVSQDIDGLVFTLDTKSAYSISGSIVYNDDEFNGAIDTTSDGDFLSATFTNEQGQDIYEVLIDQGYDLDSFFIDEVCVQLMD